MKYEDRKIKIENGKFKTVLNQLIIDVSFFAFCSFTKGIDLY